MERPRADKFAWDLYYERTLEPPEPAYTAHFLQHIPKNGRVLDFGTGTGRWALAFLRDRQDLTIDLVDQNLPQASLIPNDWKGERHHLSFQDFRPTKSYDAIWAYDALFFLEKDELAKCFHNLAASLNTNGIINFSMVHDCHSADAANFHGLTEEAILQMLDAENLTPLIIKRKDDTGYYNNKIIIPTYYIKARK